MKRPVISLAGFFSYGLNRNIVQYIYDDLKVLDMVFLCLGQYSTHHLKENAL